MKKLVRGTWKGWEPPFYKLGLLGNFGQMCGLLFCEVCFFRVLRHKADSCSCVQTFGHLKRDKQSVRVNSFLQVSCSSNESVVQQSEVIAL